MTNKDCILENKTCVNNECMSKEDIKKHKKPSEAWTIIILIAAIVFLIS